MAVYQIVHRQNESNKEYTELDAAIKAIGPAVREKDLCWFVKTDRDAADIRDSIKEHLGKTDRLLVVEKSSEDGSWAANFKNDTTIWLNEL